MISVKRNSNVSVYTILATIFLLLSVAPLYAVTPRGQMKVIKALPKTSMSLIDEVAKVVPTFPEISKKVAAELYKETLISPKYLVRAETFATNLDGDPQKEYVSQLIFKDHEMSGAVGLHGEIVYFVFIHDDAKSGYTFLKSIPFELSTCEYLSVGNDAMTFSFVPVSSGGSYNMVQFSIKYIESCGTIMDLSLRTDHLYFDRKRLRWTYGEGKLVDDGKSINRLELAE